MNVNDAIFIFSLGPVQGFIAEARRLGDLDAGSRLLVKLATAAGVAIQNAGGSLIFPVKLGDDVPNKLVARVPTGSVEAMPQAAQQAIQTEWQKYVSNARQRLMDDGPTPDPVWEAIWDRQVNSLWETYWVAAPEKGDYHAAYGAASRAFDAAKRTRIFPQIEEGGVKDSLSGRRSALHTGDMKARAYWAQVAESPNITRAELRPGGRERLDAIGAVKRWGGLVKSSPSVSLVAAADFMAAAKKEKPALAMYRKTVEALLGDHLFRISNDADWPYGGDLFFLETLTPERLDDSYGLEQPDDGPLEVVRQNLRALYRKVNNRPRPYYAIIALDGDNMGKMVSKCRTESEHQALSQKIITFAAKVRPLVEKYLGHTVYAGGDDVLALAPLSTALPLAQELAAEFRNVVGGTASAGIAIAHRLYPLSAALRTAREAEHQAKQVTDKKAALCVRVLKRSGETVDARTTWAAMGDTFERVVNLFQSEAISSKMAYAAAQAAYALPHADESFESELRRQLRRHRHPTKWTESEDVWAATLCTWADSLPDKTEGLGRWLTLARFVAQGGAG